MYSRKNGGNQMNESRVFMLNDTEVSGIHSIDPASEFYITIYGSIAQSESENISANVKWGKAQSAKQGNVPFQCKNISIVLSSQQNP